MSKIKLTAKRAVTIAVKKHIADENWDELDTLMPQADKYNCAKSLRRVGWMGVGDYRLNGNRVAEAVEAYNRARIVFPTDRDILHRLFKSLDAVCEQFKQNFSRQDLRKLEEPIEMFVNIYELKGMGDTEPILQGRQILQKIRFLIYDAPWKKETPATHAVQHIYDALYTGMTTEEVRAEFARLMAPVFREIIDKENPDDAKPKKKKTKKTKKDDKK